MLAADLVERLIDFAGADAGGDLALRRSRRAMQDAMRDFPSLHRWTYYYTHGRLQLNVPYSTGTIEYDATTRALTLTDGTWPSWAASGHVRVNDVVCRVATRVSNTVLTLDSILCLADDVDAGTTYVLYEDAYLLPANFVASDAMVAELPFGTLRYVTPAHQMWAARTADRTGTPCYYTFLPSDTATGRFAAKLLPYPDAAQTLDFTYSRRMRAVKYDGQADAGTVTMTSASAAVVGVGTAFRSDMVGATIRVSRDGANRPTSTSGISPAAFESVITAVADTTHLTVADNADANYAAVAYAISDPLDVEEGSMANALCSQAMLFVAIEMQMKNMPKIEEAAVKALIRAREHDARNFAHDTAGPGCGRRPDWRYMPTGPDEE